MRFGKSSPHRLVYLFNTLNNLVFQDKHIEAEELALGYLEEHERLALRNHLYFFGECFL
jgi:hypothetical protein